MNHPSDNSYSMTIPETHVSCLEFLKHISAYEARNTSKKRKKELGQYMTPSNIASFMATKLLERNTATELKILEPSIGSGMLLAAVADEILEKHKSIRSISVTAFEIDLTLIKLLLILEAHVQRKFKQAGIKFSLFLNMQDFLLHPPLSKYDYIITNPPFFKIKKEDPRALAQVEIVHGQPNIYGLFMAKCSDLLKPEGRVCYLTPRSWTSGLYFTKLREKLFSSLYLYAIHLFECREAPFSADRIQQESMITWLEKKPSGKSEVTLTFSTGDADLQHRKCRNVDMSEVLPKTKNHSLVISSKKSSFPSKLKTTLREMGIKASTGKVVPFRCSHNLSSISTSSTAPLYWMQHISPMKIRWPASIKDEHFIVYNGAEKLSIPASNYVLVRRFSPKDTSNHITAAPLLAQQTDSIYIENHINYIYRTDTPLTTFEAVGLAYFINSSLVSEYFSERLGHTQINASDLNNLPAPSLDMLSKIGSLHTNNKKINLEELLS